MVAVQTDVLSRPEPGVTTVRPADVGPRPRPRRRRISPIWWFAVPALVPYLFVVIVPSVQGAGFAFTDWDGLNPDWQFTGLDNFVKFFQDPQALRALTNTLTLAIVMTIFENVIGLGLALALNTRVKSRHVLRVIFFMPVVLLSIVVAFIWQFIYTPNGPINEVLRSIGLGSLAQNWLGDPNIALWAIAVMVIWQFSGYSMVIFLAGLQGVPAEQLEAASLDGANAWQRFWHVVRPLLAPAITVNLMLSLIRGLMIFDQIWVTTQGGPASSTNSLSTLVYRNAFQYGEFGYSAAMAVVLTFFVAVLGVIQYRFLLRGEKK
ncbi:carbohydrate ABC transporter permease [Microbacterium sp. NPDC058389]|uniref:carbohydrate ABC transporter permease n=1 Tax=Microbacterium sp. NPDC058389 TaxID=3346475 RepID=UPI00365BB8C0